MTELFPVTDDDDVAGWCFSPQLIHPNFEAAQLMNTRPPSRYRAHTIRLCCDAVARGGEK